MNMNIITKLFRGYPFAHRQHTHGGHCQLIHGHNWDFEITITAEKLDRNGFVYDFGQFKWLKEWFDKMFDHTCLINYNDPQLQQFKDLADKGLMNMIVVENCGAEGIAKMVFNEIERHLKKNKSNFDRGVKLLSVTVFEDHKNSATYTQS